MGKPTAAMEELAHKLVAFEGGSDAGSESGTAAATRVIEKLRVLLTRFSGLDSFTALTRRAVALSRSEHPSLKAQATTPHDSTALFKGLSDEVILTIAAHLLDLMSTFVGRKLTLELLAETWPVDDF